MRPRGKTRSRVPASAGKCTARQAAPDRLKPELHTRGFTIIELLVVISIIAIMTAIAIPAMKGIGQSNLTASATRQLLDDLALARHRAIVGRTTVHVVFVPNYEWMKSIYNGNRSAMSSKDQKLFDRLMTGSYTTYALYAERTVGDQPGQRHDRYIGNWRSLPEGIFIAESEFPIPFIWGTRFDGMDPLVRPFATDGIPFPSENAPTNRVPHIAFDQNGSLLQIESGKRVYKDEYIWLAKGSVLTARDNNGTVIGFDVRESPPGNSTNNHNRIHIDPITGRAKLQRPKINVNQ